MTDALVPVVPPALVVAVVGSPLGPALAPVAEEGRLGWTCLFVHVTQATAVQAKVQLCGANRGQGLSESEEAWVVRSMRREDRLPQPEIGALLGRSKSWVSLLACIEGADAVMTSAGPPVSWRARPRSHAGGETARALRGRRRGRLRDGVPAASMARWLLLRVV